MKKILIIAFVVLLSTLTLAAQNLPEPERKFLNSSPKAFRTFFAGFRRAVERNRRTEVTAMTRFPFSYAYDAGDEGTISRTQFLKDFKHILGDFFGEFRLARNPFFDISDEGSFVVSSESASHLRFEKTGKTFKFTGYFVEP